MLRLNRLRSRMRIYRSPPRNDRWNGRRQRPRPSLLCATSTIVAPRAGHTRRRLAHAGSRRGSSPRLRLRTPKLPRTSRSPKKSLSSRAHTRCSRPTGPGAPSRYSNGISKSSRTAPCTPKHARPALSATASSKPRTRQGPRCASSLPTPPQHLTSRVFAPRVGPCSKTQICEWIGRPGRIEGHGSPFASGIAPAGHLGELHPHEWRTCSLWRGESARGRGSS